MKLVTVEEMRQLEQAADAGGLTYETMMDRAGHAAARAIQQKARPNQGPVLVLVGPGNNGGDGLVAARYLRQAGFSVSVYLWKRDAGNDTLLAGVTALDIPLLRAEDDPMGEQRTALVRQADVVVDALLGTGATGPLRGSLADLVQDVGRILSERKAAHPGGGDALLHSLYERVVPSKPAYPLLVAIDVPSGLDCNTGAIDERAFMADLSVTFAYPKRGQFLFPGAAHVGELLIADIGIPGTLAATLPVEVATAQETAAGLPARPANAHKGTFGRALVIGGSINYVGAPCLSTEAACRVGAGLVTLAVPQSIHRVVSTRLTEATFIPLADDMGALVPRAVPVILEEVPQCQAMLIGPGLGREAVTGEFLGALLAGRQPGRKALGFRRGDEAPPETRDAIRFPPWVVDADGLYHLSRCGRWWEQLPASSVLTPHPGEMARLVGLDTQTVQADRLRVAMEAAARWGCTVVLKGAHTVVAGPEGQATVIPFANPALATAGTGDVLAGTIAGLVAQGLSGYQAAWVGAYIHGLAGEMASRDIGRAGVLAGDLLPRLPRAIASLS